jgi:uncharacterized RDD family membrane protein YckC
MEQQAKIMEPSLSETEKQARDAVIDYVGFWPRVGATLLDAIIIGLITAPPLYLIYGPEYFEMSDQMLAGPADLFISYILPAAAVILFWKYRGATPGKMLLHARIVDARTFGQPSTARLVGRYLAYFISAIPFGLGFIWVAIDRRKQGWHDKIAGTLVIRHYG